jgi:FKBP-type peptidyl-prolyl cis-trans isomerase
MKISKLLILLLLLCAVAKLYATPKYKTTNSGLKYIITQKVKKGKKPEPFQMVQIIYKSTLEDGTHIAASPDRNNPLEFIFGNNEVLKGWDEALSLLKIGEKGIFFIPPALAYGDKKVGKIPANSTIKIEMELIAAFPAFFDPFGKDYNSTESGLKYKIHNAKRSEEKVDAGNYVVIHYTGYTIDSQGNRTIFDNSRKNEAGSIVQCGVKKFISGLDEGILLGRIGDSISLIIPPALGYGAKANQLVPANSKLGFDIYIERQINPFLQGTLNMTEASGYKFGFFEKKSERNAQLNDLVTVNLTGYFLLANGAPYIFESSFEKQLTQTFRLGNAVENPAWLQVLQQCGTGDKVKLVLEPEMARTELKKLIPENVDVYFEFEILSVQAPSFLEINDSNTIDLGNGLKTTIVQEGDGFTLDSADYILVHYTGFTVDSLGNKKVFDSSFDKAKPFEVQIGMGKVIKGWDLGLKGRKENDIFRLEIPAELGYGKKGVPPLILQNETLYFDMFIVKTHRPSKESKME